MSAEGLPLWHVLYTNVPRVGGEGFRTILEYFGGPPEEGTRVGRWLAELRLAPSAAYGWAANVFAFDGAQHAALALIHPAFPLDEHQRGGGHLAHALLVRVSEQERAGDFGSALLERAREFAEFNALGRNLENYLEGCRLGSEVEVPVIEPSELRALAPAFLLEFLQASTESPPKPEVAFSGLRENELVERLVLASTTLPPKLRLNLRWAVGLQAAPAKTFLARAQPGESTGPSYWSNGTPDYRDWLWKRLEEGRFEEIKKVVQRWDITSWPQLLEAVTFIERVKASPVRLEFPLIPNAQPSSSKAPRDAAMNEEAGKRQAVPSSTKAARAKKGAAAYDEEYQALQASIKEYVDKRLALLDPPAPVSLPAPAEEVGPRPLWVPPRLWHFRAESYFALALALIGWLAWMVLGMLPAADDQSPSWPEAPLESPTGVEREEP